MEVDYKNNVVPIVVDGLKNDYLKTFSSPSSSPSNSIVDVLYLHSLINDVIYLKSISLEFPARQNSSVFKIEHWVLQMYIAIHNFLTNISDPTFI